MKEKKEGLYLDNVPYIELSRMNQDDFRYYKRVGLSIKPNGCGIKDILEWNYGKVKEVQLMLESEITFQRVPEILSFCYEGTKPDDFAQMKWPEVFKRYNHIVAEVEKIIEKEKALLSEPDADQINAGVERLQKFGTFAVIDGLAFGNVLIYDEIEAMPYKLIFAKLLLEKEKAQYQENYRRIKSKPKN